ncbi:nuclear transcription factor Y subunit B-4-like [Cicer arietinum]|uniref:Nuclear transcription factor Y subunit B-6-like n=1 Tax=Cicer arietinum TaxID=3827 RepID=A0A3Q7X2G7_CICAR|nr:nuclear transcription factor Y subunit B-6-like [Cicer arietinum]
MKKEEVQAADLRVREEIIRPLPITNVQRIMRRMIPKHGKISDESKECMVECVSEFISFITTEANYHCKLDHRTTITAEDLINTMRRLGFDFYVEDSTRYIQRYRHIECGASVGPYVEQTCGPTHKNIAPPSVLETFQDHDLPMDPIVFPDPRELLGAIVGDEEFCGSDNSSDGSFDLDAFLNSDD